MAKHSNGGGDKDSTAPKNEVVSDIPATINVQQVASGKIDLSKIADDFDAMRKQHVKNVTDHLKGLKADRAKLDGEIAAAESMLAKLDPSQATPTEPKKSGLGQKFREMAKQTAKVRNKAGGKRQRRSAEQLQEAAQEAVKQLKANGTKGLTNTELESILGVSQNFTGFLKDHAKAKLKNIGSKRAPIYVLA